MTKPALRKFIEMIGVAGLILAFSMTPALSWDLAAHAYIEENLHKKSGQMDSTVLYNRIYGAGATDLFNNDFTSPYLDFSIYLHDPTEENFLQVWDIAAGMEEKAFAYGFAGHNNSWGMDSTAHVSGLTFGRGEGYVIAKARILAAMLGPALEAQLGMELPEDVLVDLCHYLIESGVDFLVRAKDPAIGGKLMAAAEYRSGDIPLLLANAYKAEFAALVGIGTDEASNLIEAAEENFREFMWVYGYALSQNQEDALYMVAGGLAAVGVDYLGLPPGSEPGLLSIAHDGILAAMELCAPDFEGELRATAGWLNGRLSSKKIAW